jgi:hypothetical protein
MIFEPGIDCPPWAESNSNNYEEKSRIASCLDCQRHIAIISVVPRFNNDKCEMKRGAIHKKAPRDVTTSRFLLSIFLLSNNVSAFFGANEPEIRAS